MRWEVTGADATTGVERVMSFEATDEKQAAELANYNGLLVASVNKIYVGTPVEEKQSAPKVDPNTELKAAQRAKREAWAHERRAKKHQAEYRAGVRRAQEWACLTMGERAMYRIAATIGFFLTGAGMLSWFGPIVMSMVSGIPAGTVSGETMPPARFVSDNAIGASANALEQATVGLKYHFTLLEWDGVILIGLMFLFLSAFIRHRGTIRAGTMSA